VSGYFLYHQKKKQDRISDFWTALVLSSFDRVVFSLNEGVAARAWTAVLKLGANR